MRDTPTDAGAENAGEASQNGFRLKDCPVRDMGTAAASPMGSIYAEWGAAHTEGGRIRLGKLQQHYEYGGMLCGLPSLNFREDAVPRLVRNAQENFPDHFAPVAVLRPEILTGRIVIAAGENGQTRGSNGKWFALPPVYCVGMFEISAGCGPTYRGCYSVLALWWQSELGAPDARACAQLGELSVDEFGAPFEY